MTRAKSGKASGWWAAQRSVNTDWFARAAGSALGRSSRLVPAHLELTIPCTPGDTGRLAGRNGRGPPAGQGIETHCQAHGDEFAGGLLLRRDDLQGAATACEPVAPEPLAVLEPGAGTLREPGSKKLAGSSLQLVEELFDSPVDQLRSVPPLRQRLLGPAPHEVKADLHAVQAVPAAVAEAAEFLTELLDLPVL